MAYDFDKTKPADTDLVKDYPTNEQAFRTTVEAFVDTEHDKTTGHHKVPTGNTAARDAITDWVVGSLWFNTSTSPAQLQRVSSIGPVVWENVTLATLTGDVTGALTATLVSKLNSFQLNLSSPSDTNVLAWNAATSRITFQPAASGGAGADPTKLPLAGGVMTGTIFGADAGNVATASTVNVSVLNGNYFTLTGSTTVNSFGSGVTAGTRYRVRSTGGFTLTYNATSMILPGLANIAVVSGDTFDLVSLGSSNWVVTNYQRASGHALVEASVANAFQRVVLKKFTASGTYTPTTGMVYCRARLQAPGGGSGGCAATGSSQAALSGPGGGGGYAEAILSAAQIGASQAVTIGAAGAAGSAGNNAGGDGGTCSLGALLNATGGKGGDGGPASSSSTITATAGDGGNGVTGDILISGERGEDSFGFSGTGGSQPIVNHPGRGGNAQLGRGAISPVTAGSFSGFSSISPVAGQNYGGGASARFRGTSSGAAGGAAGGAGILIIEEYCNV